MGVAHDQSRTARGPRPAAPAPGARGQTHALQERRYGAPRPVQRRTRPLRSPRSPRSRACSASCTPSSACLLTAQIKRLERQLLPTLVPDADVQRLLWIPGIGKIAAFTLHLEIDGIQRFGDVRAFFSYCRLVPGAKNSGGKSRHKRTKDGNRYLKLAVQSRRGARDPILPRDPGVVSTAAPHEGRDDRPSVSREGTCPHRVPRRLPKRQDPSTGLFKGSDAQSYQDVCSGPGPRAPPSNWPRRALVTALTRVRPPSL